MSNRALIVVDIQNDYFPGGDWELSGIESAADNAAKLIAAARKNGDTIVHIRHEFPSNEAPFFRPGSKGAQTNEKVSAKDQEKVIVKNHVNSFRNTELKELLDSKQIEELVICGAMSHMCIDAITRAAADFGFKVTVIHDACASRDLEFEGVKVPAKQVHAAFMASLGFAYATMSSTEQYLNSCLAAAKHS
jgi:nicotinamidase-related amidase